MTEEIGKMVWIKRSSELPVRVSETKKGEMFYAFLTLFDEPYNENELIRELNLVLFKPRLS